jgi:putative ABC transport system permease protein
MLNLSVGDKITFSDADENPIEVIIGAISENYYGHHLYMSTDYYEKVTGQPPSYNAELLKLAIQQNEETVQRKIMDTEKALNVTMLSVLENSNMDSSLDMVMWVLIIASGCLAFVVLYNLININVSERIRELSTIKVLGFFDNEVTMYIFRENIILTILGILAGALLGKVLFKFILWSAELDAMMMVPDIYMTSYVLSACITLCFAFFVMAMMHLKLKNIDMIDALKSVE